MVLQEFDLEMAKAKEGKVKNTPWGSRCAGLDWRGGALVVTYAHPQAR